MKKSNAMMFAAAAVTGLLTGSTAFASSSTPVPASTTGSVTNMTSTTRTF